MIFIAGISIAFFISALLLAKKNKSKADFILFWWVLLVAIHLSFQFYYGMQVAKTIGQHMQLSLRLGSTNAQGKDQNALLPYYASLGIHWIFNHN